MTVKANSACRDSLMAGMPSPRGTAKRQGRILLRACLDPVEHLVRQSLDVTTAEVGTTLGVMEQAYGEMDAEVGTAHGATVALKNAIGRLKALRLELTAK
jgi:hypothetical protein